MKFFKIFNKSIDMLIILIITFTACFLVDSVFLKAVFAAVSSGTLMNYISSIILDIKGEDENEKQSSKRDKE